MKHLLLIFLLILTSCKSKEVIKKKTFEKEAAKITSVKDSVKNEKKTEEKKEVKKSETSQKKNESKTEVEIKGKAETDKPFEIHEIENGDTIQTIKIIGNADFSIKTKRSKSDNSEKKTISETLENKLENFSRNLVKEDVLKEAAKEIRESAKEVTTKNFTFGAWLYGIIGTGFLIGAIWLWFYLRKPKKII
ncbi:MAG TPA: hypothetical protein P5084_00695 [Paludibacter sp.]|nr:hypothetical protein [Paludibacter sp.]